MKFKLIRSTALYLVCILVLTGCGNTSQSSSPVQKKKAENISSAKSFKPSPYQRSLETTGRLLPWRDVTIRTRINEEVISLPAEEGDTVSSGQVVARLDTSLLTVEEQRAQHRLEQSRQQFQLAQKEFQRSRNLLKKDLTSQSEYDQREFEFQEAKQTLNIARTDHREAKIRLSYATVRAPFDGVMAEHFAEKGDLLQPGESVVRLLQLDPLDLKIEVPPEQVNDLTTGDTVRVIPPGRDQNISGTIRYIGPDVEPDNRMYPVWITLPNRGRNLSAGRTVEVSTHLETIRNTVTIPLNYVNQVEDETKITLKNSNNRLDVIDYKKDSVVARKDWSSNFHVMPGIGDPGSFSP